MKEAFVSYETAKLLKEKGFDEPCIATYNSISKSFSVEDVYQDWTTNWYGFISAPTHQMACAWLRKVHKVLIDAYHADHWDGYIDSFEIRIYSHASTIIVPNEIAYHTDYTEAVEAAIKYALENLI